MSIRPPPSARVALGTIQTANGPVDVFASTEWSRYFESLNTLTVQTATGQGGLADSNADDTWHDDLNAREALRAIEELSAIVADLRLPLIQDRSASGSSVIAGNSVITVPSVKGGAFEHTETFPAAGVSSLMTVLISIAPHSDDDENNEQELSVTVMSGQAGSGTITARLSFFEQTSGPIRINYMATL